MEEQVAQSQADLFTDTLPSMEEIKQLSEFVHSSEANKIAFGEQVEENISKTGQKGCLAAGIGLFILDNTIQKMSNFALEGMMGDVGAVR